MKQKQERRKTFTEAKKEVYFAHRSNMNVTLNSKYVKGRVYVAVVDVYYFLPCIIECYLDDVGENIIDYLDNLEDVKYMSINMYHADGGDINICKIIALLDMYGEDSCGEVFAITKCRWCDRPANLVEPVERLKLIMSENCRCYDCTFT